MFNVGDKVRIKRGSRYYGLDNSNPANVVGVVSRADKYTYRDAHNFTVKWYKAHNSYTSEDLELVAPLKLEDVV